MQTAVSVFQTAWQIEQPTQKKWASIVFALLVWAKNKWMSGHFKTSGECKPTKSACLIESTCTQQRRRQSISAQCQHILRHCAHSCAQSCTSFYGARILSPLQTASAWKKSFLISLFLTNKRKRKNIDSSISACPLCFLFYYTSFPKSLYWKVFI